MKNVLIIGLGSIAKKHVAALREIAQDLQIYALRSDTSAAEYDGVKNIYNLSDFTGQPYFCIISNPTSAHVQTIEDVSTRWNCPLFIEKPLYHIYSEELVQLVTGIKNITYVACNLRFYECLLFLKNKLSEQTIKIDEINIYAGSYLPDWRPQNDFRKGYSANTDMGGGVHVDLIHEIDYMYWLFGKPINAVAIRKSASHLGIPAIDGASYLFDYTDFVVHTTLNYFRKEQKRNLEIVCSEGVVDVDLLTNSIHSASMPTWNFNSERRIIDTYKTQLSYFITCIESGEKPMNSLTEALDVLRVCLS